MGTLKDSLTKKTICHRSQTGGLIARNNSFAATRTAAILLALFVLLSCLPFMRAEMAYAASPSEAEAELKINVSYDGAGMEDETFEVSVTPIESAPQPDFDTGRITLSDHRTSGTLTASFRFGAAGS